MTTSSRMRSTPDLQFREPFDAVTGRLDLMSQTFDEHLGNLPNAIIVIYDEHALRR